MLGPNVADQYASVVTKNSVNPTNIYNFFRHSEEETPKLMQLWHSGSGKKR